MTLLCLGTAMKIPGKYWTRMLKQSGLTSYYAETFRLFPENQGDIQKNIR
jgi:hypothetical protein